MNSSYLLSNSKEIRLRPFEELVGSFIGYNYDGSELYIDIDHYRAFFLFSPEIAEQILYKLSDVRLGRRIAILRTQNRVEPLFVRFTSTEKGSCGS